MEVVAIILKILLVLVCVAMIVLVMMQEGNENGLSSGIAGGMADNNSFAARNSGRTKEGQLKKYTRILLGAFMVIALVLNIIG